MEHMRFNEQIQAFDHWKNEVIAGIEKYQRWLDKAGVGDPEDELRIYEILQSLRSDRLTIAFVAEFARGKTELINAIFFSEYDRRLLPSEAGRTTMCPTELFYDTDAEQAYVRLLPIETRLNETSLNEYKAEPIHWAQIELDLSSPESMAEAFQEVVRTKSVPRAEAEKLGLFCEKDDYSRLNDGTFPDEIDIPMWRHALISFPHPLLKKGLVILDTPGMNALGSEPELTVSMLPSAQAVMFILAADTGVTKSDLDMWRHNVMPLRKEKGKGLIVVLNKVDTLWDELRGESSITHTIAEQRGKAAEVLGIDSETVFPVSAQKGLLAKIRHDRELLERSNVLALETLLAEEILPYKQRLVREHVTTEIGGMIKETHDLLSQRLNATTSQLEELRGLSGKNDDVITHLMKKTREEQVAYHQNVESFQANKRILSERSEELKKLLDLKRLDDLVNRTRKQMTGSWTTHGLKDGMKSFFDSAQGMLQEVDEYNRQLSRLVTTIYRKFQKEHGIDNVKPVLYVTTKYVKDLEQLYADAEEFRKSPFTTMTEQSFVVKKFFISLVSHARNVFYRAHRDADKWNKAVMTPLVRQIKEHKAQMEKRLENLRKINDSRETLESRIEELEKNALKLQSQFAEVESILRIIDQPLKTSPGGKTAREASAAVVE
ncbi:dynamin family protein [Thiohalomonas denitrificans]|uniref:Replication fork clamp-binding protein CrfC (Dynamin-like GTPase family) n=1 Tax=Thiohalomonas denitrificans TaxID=415747 RepID=A0A1G5QK02_9GAMM|nr:dynamin family protein [Thiohalomonas denitrificans]SCZ61926.1 Replication fork clamp-binding protein CrfC (dynamin-like GTPase family) [Thiohalomonas denitrificans]